MAVTESLNSLYRLVEPVNQRKAHFLGFENIRESCHLYYSVHRIRPTNGEFGIAAVAQW